MTSSKVHSYHPSDKYNRETIPTVEANYYDPNDFPEAQTISTTASAQQVAPASSVVIPPHQSNQQCAAIENPRYVRIDSRKPVMLTYCPRCAKEHVPTNTRTKVTGTTWVVVVAGLFIFWPLAWLPLVIRPCKQTNHYCNGCGAKVGRVKPFQ